MASNVSARKLTATISAQNTFSEEVSLYGDFALELSGVTSSVVTVQRSSDAGSTWVDVDTFSADDVYTGSEPARNMLYRWGIKTGDYGTDTVVGSLEQ